MIEIIVLSNALRVVIPQEMKSQAPALLEKIWCQKFADSNVCLRELTEPTKRAVEELKLSHEILVRI